jgi:hypothetical protein
MIFEIVFINSYPQLYADIALAIQAAINTALTEPYFDYTELYITYLWNYLTGVEYFEDTFENSCEETDFSDYEQRQFDNLGNMAEDYIGQYYQAGG